MRGPAVILGGAGTADPPGLRTAHRGARAPAPMFDPSPHRNQGMPYCPELPAGLLNRVIATAIAFGMPPAEASEARSNPFVRGHVAMLAVMCWDAARGDKAARAALERIRFAFGNRRPVAEILSALEQPPDSAELQGLLGLD